MHTANRTADRSRAKLLLLQWSRACDIVTLGVCSQYTIVLYYRALASWTAQLTALILRHSRGKGAKRRIAPWRGRIVSRRASAATPPHLAGSERWPSRDGRHAQESHGMADDEGHRAEEPRARMACARQSGASRLTAGDV